MNKEQFLTTKMLIINLTKPERIEYLEGLGEIYYKMKDGGDYFIDERDYNIYSIVTVGNQKWMGENLAFDSGEGCIHDYGNYFYEESALSNVIPNGWHIPEKWEWNVMCKHFGPIHNYPKGTDKIAKALLKGGGSGLDFDTVGYYIGEHKVPNTVSLIWIDHKPITSVVIKQEDDHIPDKSCMSFRDYPKAHLETICVRLIKN